MCNNTLNGGIRRRWLIANRIIRKTRCRLFDDGMNGKIRYLLNDDGINGEIRCCLFDNGIVREARCRLWYRSWNRDKKCWFGCWLCRLATSVRCTIAQETLEMISFVLDCRTCVETSIYSDRLRFSSPMDFVVVPRHVAYSNQQ